MSRKARESKKEVYSRRRVRGVEKQRVQEADERRRGAKGVLSPES